MAITPIDYMEYADHGIVQQTYQSDYFNGVEVFAVGGGGGGSAGGGGGAGGINYKLLFLINAGSYTINIGSGGAVASQGGNTTIQLNSDSGISLIAYGGGHGDYRGVGTNGGSGGGRGRDNPGEPPDVTYNQGYKGGGCLQGWYGGAGGGGGAGGVGYNGNEDSGTHPGDNTCKGGPGLEFSQFAAYGGSPAGWFSGGGSGSWENGAVRVLGGIGGGGANGPRNYGNATAGIANTGGGGGSSNANAPAIGGSGFLIIKYLSSNVTASGGTEYTDGSYKIHVFTSTGQFTVSSINQFGIIPYCENSIKYEGNYALKAIAYQTSSLNRSIIKDLSTNINLSGYSYIVGLIRSSRTGQNIKITLRNSNNNLIEIIPIISSTNTWTRFQYDISSVSDTDKNSINQIKITTINSDSDNEFYIDYLYSVQSVSDFYLQTSKLVSYAVTKIPDAFHISKAVAYAITRPPIAFNIAKAVAYAVVQVYDNEGFGHLDPELGSDLNTGSSWNNAWRTITGGPTSSRIPSGNCLVKIAKSPDPVSIGQAEWSGSLSNTTDRALQNDYYTQLLLRFDEAHNSSYTIDSSHRNQTVSCNNLLVTNAQYKLNSTSGYFNGSSTYISIPDTEFLNFGTDDWTIDFWMRPTGTPSGTYPAILSTTTDTNGWSTKITFDDPGYDRRLNLAWYRNSTWSGLPNSSSFMLNFNEWYHIAFIRNKDYLYFFINGNLEIAYNCGKDFYFDWSHGGSCRIGGNNWDGSNSYYLGYLSDLRISRKIIRWTSNFTPPISPYPSISIPKIILQTAQNVTIDNCESNWTQSTDVTTSIRTDLYNQSYGALSVIIGSNFTTGKIAYKTLSSQLDLSSYQKISFFYHVSANHASNIFKLCLCSDQSGDTIIDTFILPAVTDMSATIHLFPLTIDAGASLGSNINSIALYAISDPGTPTLIFDNIIVCKSGNSLSLNSLVSKNIQSDQWCKILSIIDNIVYISNYYGLNETIDTYQRQTYYTETTTNNYIQVSGSNGNLINYQAGYNKSTDEVDGETFYLGRTPSIGLHTNSKSNIRLRNLSFLNFGTGLYVSNSMNCDIEINNLAYNKTNYADQNSLYLNASHNNKISIKNLFYLSPKINIIDSSNNLINIKNTNLSITHSGYNNKIYASKYSESNIRQSNTFSNTKIYFQDFEIESQPENTLSSSTDNSKILSTRLYRDDSQNIITKYSGETISQTSIRNTNSGFAWKLYLSSNTDALTPLKLSILKLAVQANKLVTISCYFYTNSALITGALCCERWQLNGIDDDAIAYTTQLNTWEQLQITFTPTQDGVVEIKAYAFGFATYSVYVDDVNFTQASS